MLQGDVSPPLCVCEMYETCEICDVKTNYKFHNIHTFHAHSRDPKHERLSTRAIDHRRRQEMNSDTPTSVVRRHEYSAWMQAAIQKRAAELSRSWPKYDGQIVKTPDGVEYLVTYLVNKSEPGDREDRTCDRCRTYVAPMGERDGDRVFKVMSELGSNRRGYPSLMLIGKLCRACATAEYGESNPMLRLDGKDGVE